MKDWSAFVLIFVLGVFAATICMSLQVDLSHQKQMRELEKQKSDLGKILRLLGE